MHYLTILEHVELDEVRYEDIYPKAFVAFRQRWLDKPRAEWADYYVNFSNYNNDVLHKTAYHDPNHRDPVGVYGYPMDYVIDYPADIWYGQRAKYLRVLRSRASHVLNLQQPMTEDQALELLSRIDMKPAGYYWNNYPAVPKEFLELALERFRFRGPSRFTKAFFSVVQTRLQYNRKTDSLDGGLQTKRLRRMGFDAVLDIGQTEFEAIINNREPEQIVFLTRAAFEVVETITLREQGSADSKLTYYNSKDSFRKLAAFIATKIGDAVTTQHADLLDTYFYTRAGRRISLRAGFAKMPRSSIKVHRGADADTKEDVTVKLQSEYGQFERTYPSTTSFEAIADDVAASFSSGEKVQGFQPFSLMQDQPNIGQTVAHWRTLAQRYNIPWPEQIGEKGAALIAACTAEIDRYLRSPWANKKRFKLAPLIDQIKMFWSNQKSAKLFAPMAQILTHLAKDRRIRVNDLSSIAATAQALK